MVEPSPNITLTTHTGKHFCQEALGFKQITEENWMEADPIMLHFVEISPEGKILALRGVQYLRLIQEPELSPLIPKPIRALFEVARGAMAYGYFFYPLYDMAAEQLYRVAEAAVTWKCQDLKAPKSVRIYKDKLIWLASREVIQQNDVGMWDALRRLRNASSHPEQLSITGPSESIPMLGVVAERINSLFRDD